MICIYILDFKVFSFIKFFKIYFVDDFNRVELIGKYNYINVSYILMNVGEMEVYYIVV